MSWFKRKKKLGILEHRLTDIKYQEVGSGNGDEFSGYRWVCSCGSTSPGLPPRWYQTQEQAAQAHVLHRAAYEQAVKQHWGPTPGYYQPPGGHSG